MMSRTRTIRWPHAIVAVVTLSACADAPTRPVQPTGPGADAVKFWEVTASTRWNAQATSLLGQYPPAINAQAAALRILTYVSLAQHRAVLAAESGKDRSTHPSVAAAVGAASVTVLSGFFPLAAGALEAKLDVELAAPGWPGAKNDDTGSGEAVGRAVGAAVLARAATDNYLVKSPGLPPVGPGFWIPAPAPAPIVRGLFGVRPFFLTSADELRPPPPPAFGSPDFLAALAEVRAISDTRTAEQVQIANLWNTATPPFTSGTMNLIADELIVAHHRTEREAARILASANAAAFDAQSACFEAKFAYWFIRPPQADPAITTVFTMPNHPSYPSAHACITGAIVSVLIDAFPSERERLEGILTINGLSRVYAGIHYRFDIEAGDEIGRRAAALALAGSLE
jgi:membrane-associated phospholipid phosphatase